MKDVTIIRIDWVGSLYDPASSEFISRLENLLNTVAPGSTVLIRANSACHDYHHDWLEGLTNKLYWEDLVAHFQRVHLVLVGIEISEVSQCFSIIWLHLAKTLIVLM